MGCQSVCYLLVWQHTTIYPAVASLGTRFVLFYIWCLKSQLKNYCSFNSHNVNRRAIFCCYEHILVHKLNACALRLSPPTGSEYYCILRFTHTQILGNTWTEGLGTELWTFQRAKYVLEREHETMWPHPCNMLKTNTHSGPHAHAMP